MSAQPWAIAKMSVAAAAALCQFPTVALAASEPRCQQTIRAAQEEVDLYERANADTPFLRLRKGDLPALMCVLKSQNGRYEIAWKSKVAWIVTYQVQGVPIPLTPYTNHPHGPRAGGVRMSGARPDGGEAVAHVVASAQSGSSDATADQISRALAPVKMASRSSSAAAKDPAATAAEVKFVQELQARTTRLSHTEREEISEIAATKPNIDLEITFDYNSANISAKSLPTLQALGRALTSPDLNGSTFVIAGYTDGAGSDAFNQALSERRADSIKRYLVQNFGISSEALITVGYGKSRLKAPSDPLAALNRRVQVINIAASKASK